MNNHPMYHDNLNNTEMRFLKLRYDLHAGLTSLDKTSSNDFSKIEHPLETVQINKSLN